MVQPPAIIDIRHTSTGRDCSAELELGIDRFEVRKNAELELGATKGEGPNSARSAVDSSDPQDREATINSAGRR